MPSTGQHAADGRDRHHKYVESIDEDPCRWLDWAIVSDRDRKRMLQGLIRGMDSIERVRVWKAVERWLGENADPPREACPRQWVLDRLDEREQTLRELGERPDRLPHGPRRPPSMLDTESAAPSRERSALDKARSGVATDGGVDGAE